MRQPAVLAALAVVLLPADASNAQDAPTAAARGPNVIVVMTDDQRYDDMGPMVNTRRLIAGEGVSFTRSYVSYPVCCPSRATFLTGQYAHNNGVKCLYPDCGGGYAALRQKEYLPVWLRQAGYTTGHIGKFLNGYGTPGQGGPEVPRGWDEWYGLVDPFTYRMWGYKIFENGTTKTYGRLRRERRRLYQTDVLRNKALEFIRGHARDDAPFFLSVAFLAPHHETGHTQDLTGHLVRPAPRHRGRYAGMPLPKPPNYNEQDMNDKPPFFRRWHRKLSPNREAAILTRMHERWESLLAVDEAVADIIGELRRFGELDNTYVVFTSDHGYMQGEHRIPLGKMLPYDPSTQVPLFIRGPGIPHGRRTKALVGNVDLAPTILKATSAKAGLTLDGHSLLPFARNPGLRSLRPLLHETVGNGAGGHTNTREGGARGEQTRVPAWSAVRTTRWLYVEYRGGQSELYNLRRDPYEMRSVAKDPRRRQDRRTLRRILNDLRNCRGARCAAIASPTVR